MADNEPHGNARPEHRLPTLLRTLTPRELEVLQLVLEALSSKEIAHVLRITKRTAEQHCENLKAKLQARSTTDVLRIVAAAERMGLVQHEQLQVRIDAG